MLMNSIPRHLEIARIRDRLRALEIMQGVLDVRHRVPHEAPRTGIAAETGASRCGPERTPTTGNGGLFPSRPRARSACFR